MTAILLSVSIAGRATVRDGEDNGFRVTLAMPAIGASLASGNFSVGGVIANLISGGAGGAIFTVIIGALKNRAA
jgi:hypothetical protein